MENKNWSNYLLNNVPRKNTVAYTRQLLNNYKISAEQKDRFFNLA